MINLLSARFRKYLRRFHKLTVKACSETALFRKWCNQVFHNLEFGKYISYDDYHFFKTFKISCRLQKWKKKIEKKVFAFQIIAFELGVANSRNPEHYTWHR